VFVLFVGCWLVTVWVVSYPPQPGYPQQWGYPPYRALPSGPASTVLAYVTAGLFMACGVLSLVCAVVSWDGRTDATGVLAAVIGIVFSGETTGNVDFGISVTMTVACTTLTFALVLLARLGFVRWILGGVGALVTVYYVYAVIYLLAHDGAAVVGLVIAALLLWLAATIVAFLPATGQAMRGARPRPGYQPMPPQPPMGYGSHR
jgi:hypothetical protein